MCTMWESLNSSFGMQKKKEKYYGRQMYSLCYLTHEQDFYNFFSTFLFFRTRVRYVGFPSSCDGTLHRSHPSVGLYDHGYITAFVCR